MPIFSEWNRKTFLGNFVTEHDLQKEFFWQWELKKFCPSYDSHSVFFNMSETSWHSLRLGTWNLIEVFSKLILSNAWFFTDCIVRRSSKNNAAPSVCDIQELYFKLHISATNVRWTYFFFNHSAQCFCHTVHQSWESAPTGVIFISPHS